MSNYIKTLYFLCVLLSIQITVSATNISKKVHLGNKSYKLGKLNDALVNYENASIDAPESPHIFFNKGVIYYKKNDFKKAQESFEHASLKAEDAKFEAKCKFNLGNCAFQESKRQGDSDLNKSLAAYKKSILYYQESLSLDPTLKESAENIEVIRLIMKSILDKINKEKKKEKKKQEAQKKMIEKLKKMIEKQQKVLNKTQKTSKEKIDKLKELSNKQDFLQKETQDFSNNISKALQQAKQNLNKNKKNSTLPLIDHPLNKTKKHLDNAGVEQEQASQKLKNNKPAPATKNQEKALTELKNALKSISKKNNNGTKQDKKQGQKKQKQDQKKQGTQGKQGKNDKKGNKSAMAQLPGDADKILKEEKENKKKQIPFQSRYATVDKDW